MKNLLVALSFLATLSASAAFEDGEKVLVEGPVPPHTVGAYRPFLLPGVIAEADGVTEFRRGHGLRVWCPPTLEPSKKAELERFMALPMKPIDSSAVAYVGDDAGKALLDSLGVSCRRYTARNLWLAGDCEVVALGPGLKRELPRPEQRESLVRTALSRYALVLPGCDLELLPKYAIATAPAAADPSAAAVPDLPVFLGVKRDFAEFLAKSAPRRFPALTGGPAWMAATTPAYFGHLKHGGRSVVFMNVAPGDAPPDARDALVRLWCTVLANLNVYTGLEPRP